MATLHITEGSAIQGGAALVVSIDDKRVIVERVSTGSRVSVSRALIERTRVRLASGEAIAVHANGAQGGISYTSTIEHTVLAALGHGDGAIVRDGRFWRAA